MSWFRRATGGAPRQQQPAPNRGGDRPPNPFLQGAADGSSTEQQLALRNLQMMLYKFKSLPTEREKAAALRSDDPSLPPPTLPPKKTVKKNDTLIHECSLSARCLPHGTAMLTCMSKRLPTLTTRGVHSYRPLLQRFASIYEVNSKHTAPVATLHSFKGTAAMLRFTSYRVLLRTPPTHPRDPGVCACVWEEALGIYLTDERSMLMTSLHSGCRCV